MPRRMLAASPLRVARERLGYDLDFVHAGLCALIDDHRQPISRRTLGDWERGAQMPHPYWVRRLCLFYNVKAAELGLAPRRENVLVPTPLETPSARATYLRRLREEYGVLRLPIGPVEGFSLDAVFQPLRLCQPTSPSDLASGGDRDGLHDGLRDEGIFDQAWKPEASVREELAEDPEPLTVANSDEALKSSPWRRIMILGGPGTGKSTLLKYLIGDHAWQAMSHPGVQLPILVALPNFARSGKTFKGYLVDIVQNLMLDDDFAETLWLAVQQGSALVALDSLDEVISGRAELIDRMRLMISGAHPATTWVISSRFTDYKRGQFSSVHVTEWEVLPMDRHIRSGVAESLLPELRRRIPQATMRTDAGTFLRTLERHPRIATWGRNPLLFSLAAILYVRMGSLPDSRSALYSRVIDAIMEIREVSEESRLVLRDVFAAMAFRLFVERKGRAFLASDLIATLRAIRAQQHETWRVEEIARAMTNSGLLEVAGGGAFAFLHQTFQEYLAAHYVASLPTVAAKHEIDRLLTDIHEPYSRQLLIELAYLVHRVSADVEDYLYTSIISRYQIAKLGASKLAGMDERARSSAVIFVADIILTALVDVWEGRYRASLDTGSHEKPEDVELASAIATVFERFPRVSSTPALIAGMKRYPKRARFIGALGRIATDEARDALLAFARDQLDSLSDPPVLVYLVGAIGDAKVVAGISILREIRDNPALDLDTRIEAHTALINLGAESTFPEESVYSLDRIRGGLRLRDDSGRTSDWTRVKRYAEWIPRHIEHPLLRPRRREILTLLEDACKHPFDIARIPVVTALGKIGDEQTTLKLLATLDDGATSGDLTEAVLLALCALAERGMAIDLPNARVSRVLGTVTVRYAFLTDEVMRVEQALNESRDPRAAPSYHAPTPPARD